MTLLAHHALRRNPVWMVPLGLPYVLATGANPAYGMLFSLVILFLVPLVHALSFPLERWLPYQLRLLPVLITAATVVTLAELLLSTAGIGLHPRNTLLLRALSVAPVSVAPTLASLRSETYLHRMSVAAGLAIGFAIGYLPVALARLVLAALGYGYADTVFVGFLILALGRLSINLMSGVGHDQAVEP